MIGIAICIAATLAAAPPQYFMYAGAYTFKGGKGIYGFRFDPAAGKAAALGLVAETINPGFLAVHPNGRFLYAANEFPTNSYPPDPKRNASITAFAVDGTDGKLTPLNTVSSGGAFTPHLAVDGSGRTLVAVNYMSGSTVSFPIHADGTLGDVVSLMQHSGHSIDPRRQSGPHPHGVAIAAGNRFALIPDRGTDQIMIYKLDAAESKLSANDPAFVKLAPGSGPRHFAFRPDGKFGYVVNEINSTVTAFRWDAGTGSLSEVQTVPSMPPPAPKENTGAEIAVDRRGRFLYVSNRGHDSIGVFSIDGPTGKLTFIQDEPSGGRTPRNFAIDPSGGFLFAANQDGGNVVLFRIDGRIGKLSPAGERLDVALPVCIVFVPVR